MSAIQKFLAARARKKERQDKKIANNLAWKLHRWEQNRGYMIIEDDVQYYESGMLPLVKKYRKQGVPALQIPRKVLTEYLADTEGKQLKAVVHEIMTF